MSWLKTKFVSSAASTPRLIEAAQYGDQNAYDELLHRSYQPVKRYCTSMVSYEHAEDLAQETFLRALKSKISSEKIESVEGFMIHIAKYVCLDFLKLKAKTAELHKNLGFQRSSSIEYIQTDFEADRECERIISHLSESLKEAFLLTQLMSFSYEECAEILNIPIGTVRSRVSRAKEVLQTKIIAQKKSS